MSKPFMCGDEVAVYVPDGGCDCNYTLQRVESEQYAYAYRLMLNGSQVGDLITVPYDKYVKDCELKTVEVAEIPYSGAKPGDAYLDITFYNQSDHIYVSLASIMGGGYKFVDELPEEGDPRYIYLVDNGQGGYDRYVWDAENQAWIDIGDTSIDLSDYYTKSEIDGMISNIMLRIYPVGSIYTTIDSTNPATLFGGTWVQLTDTFLYAVPTGQADSSATTKTGGSANASYTPQGTVGNTTLTESQLPKISGYAEFRNWGSGSVVFAPAGNGHFTRANIASEYTSIIPSSTTQTKQRDRLTYSFGGGGSHNHGFTGTNATISTMPPYMRVYMWKRTA